MPDITMCSGDGCPMRVDCHRATATPTPIRQAYFLKPPIREDGACEHYWNDRMHAGRTRSAGGRR